MTDAAIRIRPPWWMCFANSAPLAVLLAVSVATEGYRPIQALWALLVALLIPLNARRTGVDLTDRKAVVRRGFLPSIEVNADEIRAVTIEPRFRVTRAVTMWTHAGRAVQLWYPAAGFGLLGARMEHAHHQVGQWWQSHQPHAPTPSGRPGAPD